MKKSTYSKIYRSGLSSKRLLLIGALVFSFALGVSATSTYAWYQITERFRITGLNMSISYDDAYLKFGKMENGTITYKEESYTLADFGQEDRLLGNVSNMYHSEYPANKTFTPCFYSGYLPGGDKRKTSVAEDGFVQMEFYVESSEDAFLYLDKESQAVPNREENAKVAASKGLDEADLNNVINAARVSFYGENMGYHIADLCEEGKEEDVAYCGVLDTLGRGGYDVDNEGKEVLYGEVDDENSSIVYQDVSSDIIVNEGARRNIFNSTHKAGTKMIDEDASTVKAAKEGALPLSDYFYDDSQGYVEAPALLALKAKTPTRLVISIYLEGWDHDMTEALCYSSFDFSLSFVAQFNQHAKDYL